MTATKNLAAYFIFRIYSIPYFQCQPLEYYTPMSFSNTHICNHIMPPSISSVVRPKQLDFPLLKKQHENILSSIVQKNSKFTAVFSFRSTSLTSTIFKSYESLLPQKSQQWLCNKFYSITIYITHPISM